MVRHRDTKSHSAFQQSHVPSCSVPHSPSFLCPTIYLHQALLVQSSDNWAFSPVSPKESNTTERDAKQQQGRLAEVASRNSSSLDNPVLALTSKRLPHLQTYKLSTQPTAQQSKDFAFCLISAEVLYCLGWPGLLTGATEPTYRVLLLFLRHDLYPRLASISLCSWG